jgi:hypothetical protein
MIVTTNMSRSITMEFNPHGGKGKENKMDRLDPKLLNEPIKVIPQAAPAPHTAPDARRICYQAGLPEAAVPLVRRILAAEAKVTELERRMAGLEADKLSNQHQ